MVYILNFLLLFSTSLLTISVFPHFKFFFGIPLLPIMIIIPLAYFRRGFEPFILASLTGVFLDLFSSYPFGTYLIFFLLITALIRIFFQEGMRVFSLWHYMGFVLGFGILFNLTEIGYLLSKKAIIGNNFIWYYLGNLFATIIFVLLFYVFSNWYFEKMLKVEDYIKRR